MKISSCLFVLVLLMSLAAQSSLAETYLQVVGVRSPVNYPYYEIIYTGQMTTKVDHASNSTNGNYVDVVTNEYFYGNSQVATLNSFTARQYAVETLKQGTRVVGFQRYWRFSILDQRDFPWVRLGIR